MCTEFVPMSMAAIRMGQAGVTRGSSVEVQERGVGDEMEAWTSRVRPLTVATPMLPCLVDIDLNAHLGATFAPSSGILAPRSPVK